MSEQPEITDTELDWMEKAYGGGGVTIGRQEVVRLITEVRRLRKENESLGNQCDDMADYSGQRDIEIERLNETIQSLRGRLDDEAQKPLNEEFECHSDDAREDS